jgi:hypothetical protein
MSGATKTYALTANQAKAYYYGDPVGLVGGQPVPITASPTTTVGADSPIGIFVGCEYEDPKMGFVNAISLPANAITAGAKKVKLKIVDNTSVIMMAQSNAPITADKVGFNVPLVAASIGTGNALTGNSKVAVDGAAAAVGATLALRIYGFSDRPESVPGDAFTDVLVVWTPGVHRLDASAGL